MIRPKYKKILPAVLYLFFLLVIGCASDNGVKENGENVKTLFHGVNDISSKILQEMVKDDKEKILFLPLLDDKGNRSRFGSFFSKRLNSKKLFTSRFGKVKRVLLGRALKNSKFALNNLINPKAYELDELLKLKEIKNNVDVIASGNYKILDDKSILISMNLYDTETSKLFIDMETKIVLRESDIKKTDFDSATIMMLMDMISLMAR